MPRKAPEAINRLSGKTLFHLTNFVQAKFVSAELDDTGFAKLAQEELGTPITAGNVLGARRVLDIPCHRELVSARKELTGMAELRQRVETLERRLNVYFSDGKKT